jgi:threonine aldolase
MASLAAFSGCMVRPARSAAGTGILTWDDIKNCIAPKIYFAAQTGLVSLENTHNMAGGAVTPLEVTEDICKNAKAAGLPVHLDGARIFNAAAALGKSVAEITKPVDSVMFCLSKGLGAPVGSLLLGSKKFIEQARIYRKALGGGMRQAGILAAAGLIALEKMPARLHEDHANAKFLAEGIADLPGVKLDVSRVQTNIVIFEVDRKDMTAADLARKLGEKNILASATAPTRVRFVTHMDVDRAACAQALEAMRDILT